MANPKIGEREAAESMLRHDKHLIRPGQIIIGDKGFAGREFEAFITGELEAEPIRPDRRDEKPRFGKLGGIRQWVESVFDTMKGQLTLQDHGGRTTSGVYSRVAGRLLAAAGIWHNWLTEASALFLCMPHRVVVGALQRPNGLLLVHHCEDREHAAGLWDFLGGHVENGEAAPEALARELHEEIGVLVNFRHAPALRIQRRPDAVDGLVLDLWLIKHWQGNRSDAAPDEHDDVRGYQQSKPVDWRWPTPSTDVSYVDSPSGRTRKCVRVEISLLGRLRCSGVVGRSVDSVTFDRCGGVAERRWSRLGRVLTTHPVCPTVLPSAEVFLHPVPEVADIEVPAKGCRPGTPTVETCIRCR